MSTLQTLLENVRSAITEIDVDAARAALERGATPVDVREASETAEGHLDGALLIPRGLLELRIEEAVPDRSRELVLYCGGGTRSAFAAATLAALGYTNVRSLAGGFAAWKQQGLRFSVPRTLTAEQTSRYSRHLLIPEVGEAGQRRLLDSKVLLVGAGGLGSPAAYYLAAAGVGTLGVIDSDVVDRSNLQRQILHTEDRIGVAKVVSAKRTIEALNPDCLVNAHEVRLTADNVVDLFSGYDVIVDGGDNFATRYLVNDACVHLGIPSVTGSVYRFEGQVTVVKPGEGPCYRCLYPEPPPPELAPACHEAGVLGVVPGTIGLIQATEVLKLLLGVGTPLIGRLIVYDALDQRFRELKLARDPGCRVCGESATFAGFERYDEFCGG
ncbi:MAG: molybdopterin-synthase adenylyltransferase MoeB [Myxococcales bacterium]|nr:molybdopterin-synthase adenylyltransferase MoeB [Myxococcales bacterium]MCB9519628.1 molybdopterin-synthase adenylyltransferase MoeB [Myxococcales bacterium]MCB9530648.1 molybdopterin-synthase adenylyltransferase MoeB [Myxococcales bacterium]